MLRYNTQQKRLILPEYGRNIQSMVDHCLTIEDRQERTRCAYSIVASMANLFPELKSGGEYNHKLWDHLAIMSGFQLDIDYPCEVIQKDNLSTTPEHIGYGTETVKRRQYGSSIQRMIDHASAMEEGEERDALVKMIASQMKKLLLSASQEGVEDAKIFRDMAEMSGGAIRISPDQMKLHDYIVPVVATGKKKKRK